jgi:hypothetical protein
MENAAEVSRLKHIVSKRESENKQLVVTLKQYADDKKALENELAKRLENAEGHQNPQQKIQHLLKIKEENNKLRSDNYRL